MPKAKNPPIKKVICTRRSGDLKAADKVIYALDTKSKCSGSAAYSASMPCQNAMATWTTAADALAANLAAQTAARSTLALLESQEPALAAACDDGETGFVNAVQATAKGDVTIATGMGIGVRADPAPPAQAQVPMGVRITTLKRTGARVLTWDPAAGANGYQAQMSVDPATDTSWGALYGKGKKRALPPLIPGQRYAFRVCTVGKDSKPTAWSTTVILVA